MLVPLNPKRDLRLSGQVIYTGNSSMEVAVKMEHIGMNQPDETVLLGIFFTIYTCSQITAQAGFRWFAATLVRAGRTR